MEFCRGGFAKGYSVDFPLMWVYMEFLNKKDKIKFRVKKNT